MSILDRFRRKQTQERLTTIGKRAAVQATPKAEVKAEAKAKEKKVAEAVPEKKQESKPVHSAAASETAFRVIVRPLVTEKSTRLGPNTYVFEVRPSVNKHQIARAVHELYGVTPLWVRVQNYDGKYVRYGRHMGKTKNWKKAIVGLKEGETIRVTEGV